MRNGDHGPPYLGRHVGRTHKFVRAWADRTLADHDSNVTEWVMLRFAGAAPEPGLSQSELAHFADMSGPALVRHLDRLEEEGVLVRVRDADDRRVTRLRLTDAGHDRVATIGVVMEDLDRQLRGVLTEDEAAVMTTALDKLFTFAIEQLSEEDTP